MEKLDFVLKSPLPESYKAYRLMGIISNDKFDELELPGAKDYDEYLKVKYGDYMKLPPEEKRKIHPVSRISLLGEDTNEKI